MSLSAVLSIFAPPSGLAPNGGEGASGEDGLFAGMVEAETDGAEAKASTKASAGRVPDDSAVTKDAEGISSREDDAVLDPQTFPVVQSPEVRPTGSPKTDPGALTFPTESNRSNIDTRLQPQETADSALAPRLSASSTVRQTTAPDTTVKAESATGPATGDKPVVEADPSRQIEASKQAVAGSLPVVDRSGQTTARSALETRVAVRTRDVANGRAPAPDTGASGGKVEDATSDGTIDPAIIKAVRVPNAPLPVAPPPVAPALATTLQGAGNAPVASTETSASAGTATPGLDRAPGASATTAPVTTASPDTTRAQAEIVPLPVAEPTAEADTVLTDGRVETVSESAPATPAAVNASSLSRASIETTALLAAQIARRLEGRSTRFDMALTPEGLGRVDVRVEIDADGQLAARLAFDNPAAATELRGRADELRRQLEDAGFTLSRDALDFSERDSSSGGQGAFERQQRRAAYAHRISSEPDLAASPAAWSPHPGTPRGVDVKV